MKKTTAVLSVSLILLIFLSCSKGNDSVKPVESGMASKGDSGYTYKITTGAMEFHWSITGQNIHAKVKGETAGWVAVGFNPSEGMKDGNFIMGLVKDGKVVLSNQFGISKYIHKNATTLGGRNHILNSSGFIKDNVTEISFDYPLTTGDKLDRPININGDTVLLVAMSRGVFLSQQHNFRSKLIVNLSKGNYSVISSSGD
jgi:hypothetical protein